VAQTVAEKPVVDYGKFTMEQLLANSGDPLHKVAALTLDTIVQRLLTAVTPYLFLLPCKRMKPHTKENDLSDAPPASTWGDLESIFGIPITAAMRPFYRGLFIRPTGGLHVYEQTEKDGWYSRPPDPNSWHAFEAEEVIEGLERIKGEIREHLANLYVKEDHHGAHLDRMAFTRHIMNLRDAYKL
jgi:hypothetical protein